MEKICKNCEFCWIKQRPLTGYEIKNGVKPNKTHRCKVSSLSVITTANRTCDRWAAKGE